MSDLDEEFDQAAEFLERAGSTAGMELVLEMLRDALEAVQALSARIAALENPYQPAVVGVGGAGGGQVGGGGYWVNPINTQPKWGGGSNDQTLNIVSTSSNTTESLIAKIDDILGR